MHTRSKGSISEKINPEIEKSCKKNRKEKRERDKQIMAEDQAAQQARNRALQEYTMPTPGDNMSSIVRPTVDANNFEIKPAIIQMVSQFQFGGLPSEDPNAHLAQFLEICDTFKMNGVSSDAIKLRLFPFSLRDKAKLWLHSLAPQSINTWDVLSKAFLSKYFPPGKTAKFRQEITSFTQQHGESLYEAWERFKDLQRQCPHHGVPKWLLIQTFYQGLTEPMRITIDATAQGSFMSKTPDDAFNLLETMASNNYQWHGDRSGPRKVAGMHEVDNWNLLNAKIDMLTKKLEASTKVSNPMTVYSCDYCGGGHSTLECQGGFSSQEPSIEQLNALNNFQRNQGNPYSNTYNPGWRNHPNFSWSNQGGPPNTNQGFKQPPPDFQHKNTFHQ